MKIQKRTRTRSLLVSVVIAILWTTILGAQEKTGNLSSPKEPRQFVVLLKRGPNWIPGKSVSEQPLEKHGRYLKELMDKGSLQFAGPFLDDSSQWIGLILLNAKDVSEARQIAVHDPGVEEGILEPDLRPFRIMFDAATGKSPFK